MTLEYQAYLLHQLQVAEGVHFLEPWFREMVAQRKSCCIPTIDPDDDKPGIDGRPGDGYFEKRFGRIAGGPPPRGKPKPPQEKPQASITDTAAIHRAISVGRR